MMEEIGRTLNFTHDYLKDFLKFSKGIAPIFTLAEWNEGNGIILRHDVDLDIQRAFDMAQIEKELGIRSTFFIMTSSYYYNPLFSANSKLIKSMFDDGFEIGLHFDPSIYDGDTPGELQDALRLECGILESIIGQPVRSISLHNPSLSGLYPIFDGYNNAYSAEIFSDENYLSDSCMDFRGKEPFEFIKRASDMPVQVVLHPMHWSEKSESYIEYFDKYIHDMVNYIDKSFRANRTYKKNIGDDRLEDKIWGSEYGKKDD